MVRLELIQNIKYKNEIIVIVIKPGNETIIQFQSFQC